MPVMITNGGDHPPETAALHAAKVLFPDEAAVVRGHVMQAETVRLAIAMALAPHHEAISGGARAALDDDSGAFDGEHDVTDAVAAGLSGVRRAVAGTPWEADFAEGSDGAARAMSVLTTHFNTAAHTAKAWAAKASDAPEAAAFLARHHPGA